MIFVVVVFLYKELNTLAEYTILNLTDEKLRRLRVKIAQYKPNYFILGLLINIKP